MPFVTMRNVLALGLALGMASPACAGDIYGQVHDARGAPAAGMVLVLEETGAQTVTATDGSYRFSGLAAGQHTLAMHIANGQIQRARVNVDANGETRRILFMFSAQALAGMANNQLTFGDTRSLVTQDDAPQSSATAGWF